METLTIVQEGANIRIVRIYGRRGLYQRLMEWGIIPGAVVKVIFNRPHSPLILNVNNVTVAIGRGMADRILVEKVG